MRSAITRGLVLSLSWYRGQTDLGKKGGLGGEERGGGGGLPAIASSKLRRLIFLVLFLNFFLELFLGLNLLLPQTLKN